MATAANIDSKIEIGDAPDYSLEMFIIRLMLCLVIDDHDTGLEFKAVVDTC